MQDVEVGGCPISKGERVSPLLGAANTDPAEFADPDVVDFARSPNRHRAFGGGPHRCLGSHLARMELRVALREFHRRIPDYEIPPGTELTYTSRAALGGIAAADVPRGNAMTPRLRRRRPLHRARTLLHAGA